MPEPMVFDRQSRVTFAVSKETRTIRGLAVPFDEVGNNGFGKYRFSKGSLEWGKVKFLDQHNWAAALGTVTFEVTEAGLEMAAKVVATPEGDRILALATPDPDTGEAVYDGLSIGLPGDVEFTEADDGVFEPAGKATVLEVSITPLPAFTSAQVRSVAASAAPNNTQEVTPMGDENTTTPPAGTEAPGATDFSAVTTAVTTAISEGFAAIPAREHVPAGEGVQREELPYRFDGTRGAHGFLADIRDQKFAGNGDAATRLERFLGEAFANITVGNVAGHNPTPTRPELFVDNLHFGRPLWNLVSQGTLDDITAFIVPKFASSSGLVGAHAAGVEPTEGAYTATTQTITPTPMSGKAILNREVVDQGGNPKVDAIIWNEMVSGYYDDLEESIQTALNAVATGEQNFGAGADDKAKVMALKAFLASLQFVKGGDRFSAFAADPTAYGVLTGAVDTTGRPLLPVLGATNSDGTLAPSMESVSIGGKRAVPCWALNETVANAEESYLFVPQSVYAWQSAPRRIDLETKVSSVEVGIWGYKAVAVTRDSDVIPLDFTTADV